MAGHPVGGSGIEAVAGKEFPGAVDGDDAPVKEHGATVWTSQGNGKKKYYYISVAGASCRISSWFYDWLLSSSTRRHSFSSVIKGNTVKQYQSLSF